MAMSFAMLASRFTGIEIEEPHVVEKSFPNFWRIVQDFGLTVAIE
jgi:3-phosphoshikimate 1-carboxyvinyltransferase